jgi:hypothetical protein
VPTAGYENHSPFHFDILLGDDRKIAKTDWIFGLQAVLTGTDRDFFPVVLREDLLDWGQGYEDDNDRYGSTNLTECEIGVGKLVEIEFHSTHQKAYFRVDVVEELLFGSGSLTP